MSFTGCSGVLQPFTVSLRCMVMSYCFNTTLNIKPATLGLTIESTKPYEHMRQQRQNAHLAIFANILRWLHKLFQQVPWSFRIQKSGHQFAPVYGILSTFRQICMNDFGQNDIFTLLFAAEASVCCSK